jgi:hypothetical protein
MAAGTHWIGGWVGPRAGLDIVVPGLEPPIIQPVAQSYITEISRLLNLLSAVTKIQDHKGT